MKIDNLVADVRRCSLCQLKPCRVSWNTPPGLFQIDTSNYDALLNSASENAQHKRPYSTVTHGTTSISILEIDGR